MTTARSLFGKSSTLPTLYRDAGGDCRQLTLTPGGRHRRENL
ncbi:hypothetical protein HMPREF0591_0305 [Mycobacterium parascrofulaceum ATCC BAA-614]|uniref:Uncharacterized protein n=1 Tax=Mycobacterium parascrofulaceum ATCC BAA-614 TaxID=525368 RepID=D5P2B1_9MYCO|nr:hypothetical protein HMPREF0591_0305 [Mycobacterium parascrofulaceum ATCC BAA-614]